MAHCECTMASFSPTPLVPPLIQSLALLMFVPARKKHEATSGTYTSRLAIRLACSCFAMGIPGPSFSQENTPLSNEILM
ncbi:hypothetical protein [African swine fever virus]|uniref:Uncharacterized protein n=1 Tax=African swine fever virus TaxID=10497 RepID=A0A3G1EV70_ASF|nr:hypothetical protein F8221_gp169 [African swine fever virus]AOO54474.1 hypothetical protein AFSV47Ss_0169 [African swine fever virus]QIM06810.1 hypothetical protein [African swine fever virus]QIM07045.1 hypothetical protein [African swine fever virus]QIM07280.1 hypothetical protein [African swine fever virus]QIM07515.1 hypothetical protein [African swine fever virus]